MKRNRKNLKKPRTKAYKKQQGRCYYCDFKMWLTHSNELKQDYSFTRKQSKFLKCTGEHLTPFKDGGSCSSSNIVAACWWCNSRRHRRKNELSATQFKVFVEKRLNKGRWHSFLSI